MSSKRILLVDDEDDIREVASISMGAVGGWQVCAASSGPEAIAKALTERPDAILLDVMMPGMDGFEVCRHLKGNPVTAHIPVVFLSAKGQEAEVQSGLDAGADEYLLKPFAPDQLTKKVAEILGKAKAV